MSNLSRFTSDRRGPDRASWKDDADWTQGVAENVDAVGGSLIGQSTSYLDTFPEIVVDEFNNGDLSAWTNYGTGGGSISSFTLKGSHALRVDRSSSNGNFLRNWSLPTSGRIELWFGLAYDGIGDFATFGDFAGGTTNGSQSGFRVVHDSDRIYIQTAAGKTTVVTNPSGRSYYAFRLHLDLSSLVVESVSVDGSVTSLDESFQGNSPLSELVGVRTGDGGSPHAVFLDGIRYGQL